MMTGRAASIALLVGTLAVLSAWWLARQDQPVAVPGQAVPTAHLDAPAQPVTVELPAALPRAAPTRLAGDPPATTVEASPAEDADRLTVNITTTLNTLPVARPVGRVVGRVVSATRTVRCRWNRSR